MATTIKTNKKEIITKLEQKNEELQKENEELMIENDELKAQLEELKQEHEEKIEALKEAIKMEVMAELNKKKEPKKKEPEYFEGNLQEYTELGKDLITKKELLDWIKNPEEVKNILITKQSKPHNPSGNPEKASKEGTCNAMANWGKTKCYRTGVGEWCYCKQHIEMFNRGTIHGDAREGKDWEMEEEWKEMVKQNKIKTKEDKKKSA